MSEQDNRPAWWRVPQNKAPADLRAGDVVQTPKGERTVKTVRQEDTVVVTYLPSDEPRGPDKQVHGADDYVPVVKLGETMPTNEELVAVLEAVDTESEFKTYVSVTARDEAMRRGWIEQAHRLTPTGRMVIESVKAETKRDPSNEHTED